MGVEGETVCVTGAAGFIGSWLVMRLLERGYIVKATVRDPDNLKKNEVIKPTIEGMLNIMRSCLKAKTFRRLVFTSSAGTVNGEEHQQPEYDENCWTDIDFCRTKKMTGWMYFVSKTLAEKAAWEFAEQNNIDFISIIPTLVVGPFLTSSMPPSLITALSPITRNEAHYSILKQIQLVHIDDLCNAHIFLFEHPEAKGRYICSTYNATIMDVANLLRNKFPEYNVPTKFKDVDESLKTVAFSSKKLTDLGFSYKHTEGEDMFVEAVASCREKGLLPLCEETKVNDESYVEMKKQEVDITNKKQAELMAMKSNMVLTEAHSVKF
ncbi:Dihydroflavonol 4-reductase [Thalictrum thalictroides]|uniref:Flavanone 4-reductase n=1 Tax=Thalictrum thalictroides TaxID=46969 RepID=A0A7J6X0B0_THATH|nr:Dihydroflavonol 4-reductase [Thalictrum thalictroides]